VSFEFPPLAEAERFGVLGLFQVATAG